MLEFKLPDLGEGISEAEIISWFVKEGDEVAEHQDLLEVETDKAIVAVPSPAAGRVGKLHHAPGDTVQVGEVLVTLETAAEPAAAGQINGHHAAAGSATAERIREVEAASPSAPPPAAAATDMIPPAPKKPAAPPDGRGGGDLREDDAGSVVGRLSADAPRGESAEVLASPAVRRLARRLGVPLDDVRGTGLGGRMTEGDVRRAAERLGISTAAAPAPAAPAPSTPGRGAPAPAARGAQPAPGGVIEQTEYGPVEKRPLRGVRRAISQHLSKAARIVVAVTNMDEADVTELVRIRAKEEKAAREHGVRLSYLPFIIKAVIQALKQHPTLNSTMDDENEEIILRKYYNIGIAVDTPDGLMVPVIKNADKKSMLDIAGEIQHLAKGAHDRSLALHELRGGTFTITNLGTIGGTNATPIVNYPEAAILAVGRIKDRVVPRDGQIVIRKMVGLSLTFDHRLIDGGDGARFLNTVIQHIEDPDLILIKSSS